MTMTTTARQSVNRITGRVTYWINGKRVTGRAYARTVGGLTLAAPPIVQRRGNVDSAVAVYVQENL